MGQQNINIIEGILLDLPLTSSSVGIPLTDVFCTIHKFTYEANIFTAVLNVYANYNAFVDNKKIIDQFVLSGELNDSQATGICILPDETEQDLMLQEDCIEGLGGIWTQQSESLLDYIYALYLREDLFVSSSVQYKTVSIYAPDPPIE